ncbi:hypothetical protein J2Y66_002607 [Paenarthrobacter nitroguajacolicus]|uniref:DUF4244 domain-containing protein n=1 Tax=Paenarthrobacter nitroguajacolicus TaxID=211146 RepID=UPI0028674E8E|nr:DUF4244 domain-containing protein [Paenarthrobacter nitroguajacolicus]MDR6988109.1 hypothetical protein [Paenarthrobacter nitroguajacolicus]
MKPLGIEQFELDEFRDSGLAELGLRGTGADVHIATSHGAVARQEPRTDRKQRPLQVRRPGRGRRRSPERLRTRRALLGSEVGMATAEYAIATLAAVGLAGLLVVILRSEEVRGFLLNLIRTALSLP